MSYCLVKENNNINRLNLKKINLSNNTFLLNKKINKKSIKGKIKIAKKIKKKLEKNEIEKIILSKELKKDLEFIDALNIENVKIVDGKKLMKYLAKEIVEYILNVLGKEKKKMKIAILSNELSDVVIQKIKYFASEYKEVTIITNHPKKIMKLEKEIYENCGISIIITNNKKKALLKRDIILNFDFIEEEINKFYIKDNSVIVNFEDKIEINNKRFNGINICDYEITNFDKLEEDYEMKDIIEAETNFNTSFFYIRDFLEKNAIKINKLITFRGIAI